MIDNNKHTILSPFPWLVMAVVLISCNGHVVDGNNQVCSGTLYIAGLFPFNSPWGQKPKLAAELAIDMINQRSDILANYTIKLQVADTKVCI